MSLELLIVWNAFNSVLILLIILLMPDDNSADTDKKFRDISWQIVKLEPQIVSIRGRLEHLKKDMWRPRPWRKEAP